MSTVIDGTEQENRQHFDELADILKAIEKKHGVAMQENDPALTLVSLCQLVLDKREQQIMASFDARSIEVLTLLKESAGELQVVTQKSLNAINEAKEQYENVQKERTDILVKSTDYASDTISALVKDIIDSAKAEMKAEQEAHKAEIKVQSKVFTWSALLVLGVSLMALGYLLASVFMHKP